MADGRYKSPLADYGQLPEQLTALHRKLEEDGSARSLTSASIGAGGLTVKENAELVVDGGTIDLSRGDVYVAPGSIPASSLSSQIAIATARNARTGWGIPAAKNTLPWDLDGELTVHTETVKVPEWATNCSILVSTEVRLMPLKPTAKENETTSAQWNVVGYAGSIPYEASNHDLVQPNWACGVSAGCRLSSGEPVIEWIGVSGIGSIEIGAGEKLDLGSSVRASATISNRFYRAVPSNDSNSIRVSALFIFRRG